MVDDQDGDRAAGGFELEAELFLKGGEDVRGRVRIGRAVDEWGRLVVGRPLQRKVVMGR